MPVGVADFAIDTAHLSHAEMGLYWRMCMGLWVAPRQRFPNDDAWLARRFACAPEDARALVQEFFQSDGNWITHKRIKKEHEWVVKQSHKQSDRSKSRWKKEKSLSRGNAAPALPPEQEQEQEQEQQQEDSTDAPDGASSESLDALYYRRGKDLLGPKAGGQLTKLKNAVGGIGQALELIEHAATKQDPAEYVAGAIRKRRQDDQRREVDRFLQ